MMDNWKKVPLGELVTIQKGKISEQSTYLIQGFAPIINTDVLRGDVKVWGKIKGSVNCVEDDVLILWDGERSGLCAIGYKGVLGSTFAKMNVSSELVPEYLFRVVDFNYDWIQGQRTGTGVPHVPKDLKTIFKVNFPPLPQQQKIAKILSTIDNVIEKTESAIAKYQAIKQGLMHDLFTRGIDVNTGKLRPTPHEAPELYKESALGLLPRDWEVEELGKENETYAGGTPNRSIEDFYKGDIPWVASGEVNKSFIHKTKESITIDALRFSSAKMAPTESVLIAMYGATAAQVSMLKIEACTNQAVLAIIPNSLWNNYFIYYGLNYSKDRILFLAQGSGQPNLNKSMIDSTLFWKPKLDEQEIIIERLNVIESKIQTEQQALAKYQQVKAGLLQDLLTGEVEVAVD